MLVFKFIKAEEISYPVELGMKKVLLPWDLTLLHVDNKVQTNLLISVSVILFLENIITPLAIRKIKVLYIGLDKQNVWA